MESTIAARKGRAASVATTQELVGKLRFARSSGMGRFGQAALTPRYRVLAWGGGRNSKRVVRSLQWWEMALPHLAPRVIRCVDLDISTRIFRSVAGNGAVAGIAFPD